MPSKSMFENKQLVVNGGANQKEKMLFVVGQALTDTQTNVQTLAPPTSHAGVGFIIFMHLEDCIGRSKKFQGRCVVGAPIVANLTGIRVGGAKASARVKTGIAVSEIK